MPDLVKLAEQHFELCHVDSALHRAELLIWYADVDAAIDDGHVGYHCPDCGRRASSGMDEFVHHETRGGLQCDACRGEPEERVGALD